jgi:uncharacterized alpha-E superfamily protein
MAALDMGQVASIIHAFDPLDEPVDYLVVDVAAGISPSVLTFMAACQHRLVVLQDQPASIADAYGLIKVMAQDQELSEIYLVANAVQSDAHGQQLASFVNDVTIRFLATNVKYIGCVGADELVRSGSSTLSSRAAENLFWLGRYSERGEDSAGLLRVALPRFSVDDDVDRAAQAPLLALGRALGVIDDEDETETALLDALYEAERMGGLRTTLLQVQRVAFGLRDRLSVDHWRTINRLLQDPAFDAFRELPQAMGLLDRIVDGLVTQSGFALDGMTRDTGWRFMSIGRRIERLRAVCAAVACAAREGHAGGLDWLLEFCDSSITYRSRYMGQPEWLPALDLVIRDETNPRSVAFQLRGLADVLARVDHALAGAGADLAPAVLSSLGPLADATALVPDAVLAARLDAIAGGAAALSDRLSLRFFSHADERGRATLAV